MALDPNRPSARIGRCFWISGLILAVASLLMGYAAALSENEKLGNVAGITVLAAFVCGLLGIACHMEDL